MPSSTLLAFFLFLSSSLVIALPASDSLPRSSIPSGVSIADLRSALRARSETLLSKSKEKRGLAEFSSPFACRTKFEPVPCTDFDVIIIGGGPAGLQTALSLGRLGRTSLIIDSQDYRNDPTLHAHDVIALDGLPPYEIRNIARTKMMSIYPSIHYQTGLATSIASLSNGTSYRTTTTVGTFTSRKVVLASGVQDVLPDIKGMEEIWGTGGYWCPWCDGWEHRNGPLAVLDLSNTGEAIVEFNLNPSVTIYTNAVPLSSTPLSSSTSAMLKGLGIPVVEDKIVSVGLSDKRNRTSKVVLRLEGKDGERKELVNGVVFTTERPFKSPSLIKDLGVQVRPPTSSLAPLTPPGFEEESRSSSQWPLGPSSEVSGHTEEDALKGTIVVDGNSGQTSVFGVWAVGDIATSQAKNVANAIFSGKSAAVKIVFRLAYEEARAAGGLDWRF